MVINPNAQVTGGTTSLCTGAASKTEPAARREPEASPAVAEDESGVAISTRASAELPSTVPPIADEDRAQEIADFIRLHILSHPTASVSVQANSHPRAVLDLLDGILG